ncbi:hypothetical protein [Leptospira interrogans]|uniref:hypothetical protein n=1 Tax=Leptospira interrogans TaxID=173 RepID=UPI00034516CA|nr:hypothetical protein [Leptospira interrogans]
MATLDEIKSQIKNFSILIFFVFFPTTSCYTTIESIKEKPISLSCPNLGLLTLPNETEIYQSDLKYVSNHSDFGVNYDPNLKGSLIEQSVKDSSSFLPQYNKLSTPLFYNKDYYLTHPIEYIALNKNYIIEKPYVTDALKIDSIRKLNYFKFVYFAACKKVTSIPFWDKIKAVQNDKRVTEALISEVKQNGITYLVNLIKSSGDETENKERYYKVLNGLLQEKGALLLKRDFKEFSKYVNYEIIYSNGKNTGYYLKDLFRLSLNKNPNNGAFLSKNTFYLKNSEIEKGYFELHYKMNYSGEYMVDGPEIYFKVHNEKIVLSGLQNGIRKNEPGWELAAFQLLKLFDNYAEIDSFNFQYLNVLLIDSLK